MSTAALFLPGCDCCEEGDACTLYEPDYAYFENCVCRSSSSEADGILQATRGCGGSLPVGAGQYASATCQFNFAGPNTFSYFISGDFPDWPENRMKVYAGIYRRIGVIPPYTEVVKIGSKINWFGFLGCDIRHIARDTSEVLVPGAFTTYIQFQIQTQGFPGGEAEHPELTIHFRCEIT